MNGKFAMGDKGCHVSSDRIASEGVLNPNDVCSHFSLRMQLKSSTGSGLCVRSCR
uniref:Uncharacterized protein n=1 Tax=Arundo donax TaxID=35708 RepID=A0A0A9H215_ARUDO